MISVIIPNLNGKKYLAICLDSLCRQTYKDFEMILVDNGSTDDSVNFVEKNYPGVKIIRLTENKGFSAAVNIGIKTARGELIALLNNDAKTTPTWLEKLSGPLFEVNDIGFCASKILKWDNPGYIDSTGIKVTLCGAIENRGAGQRDGEVFNKEIEVFGACAAAALYRRSMLEETGLFDEDFFAYFEDVDLSFRAQLMGYKCLYLPDAVVYHVGGGTAKERKSLFLRYAYRNWIGVIIKNFPDRILGKYFFLILWEKAKDFIHRLLLGQGWLVTMGTFEGLCLFGKMYKKRLGIQRRRRVSDNYLTTLLKNSSF